MAAPRSRKAARIPVNAIVAYDPAVPIASLVPYPGNPREGDVGAIAESFKANDIYKPIVVQRSTGYVLSGNHRLKAAEALGVTALPVTYVEVDEDRARQILLADNRTSDLATNNDDALLALLNAHAEATGSFYGTGFDDEDADELRERLAAPLSPTAMSEDVDEEVPPLPDTPTTQLGEVIALGRHRLVCGDASDPAAWHALLDGEVLDCVWTDPPYGMKIIGGARAMSEERRLANGGKTIQNDDLDPEALAEFLRATLGAALAHTKAGGVWYVAAPQGPLFGVFATVLTEFEVWRQTIAWVKDSFVLGRSDYHYRHEAVFYGWKPGAAHFFVEDRTQDSVWEVSRPKRSTDHPTMKPLGLITRALDNSTRNGELVGDPFGGSGTTLLACEATARTARLIELDPRYCDVIVRRWEEQTGETAERVGTFTPTP